MTSAMKSLRKSLNSRDSSSRPQISTPVPLPPVSKPPSAILPPQKVIRALSSYRSQAPQELSFIKGDFFYVLKDLDSTGSWYEAHNPVSGARGLVPRSMFEEFGKSNPTLLPSLSSTSIKSDVPISPSYFSRSRISQAGPAKPITQQSVRSSGPAPAPPPQIPKHQVYYARVLHDFEAERGDELEAKRGDSITVVAQSNREWFVAKPIGRLGRPGLIPVAFVEIHDPSTGLPVADLNALMDQGELPKVEDWKRAMMSYKANSIALGVIDPPLKSPGADTQYVSQPLTTNQPPQPTEYRPDSPDALPEGILLSADVVSFHYEMEDYWFRVDAIFQPYNRPGQTRLPPSKQLILFRQYNDFYDFQVSLLDTFPREAGREPPEPRTLPYMPGPAQEVDDALTATRRLELDEYVHSLCNLGQTGGRYILEHLVVRKFLALKPGDVENEGDPRTQELEALFNTDQPEDSYRRNEYDMRQKMDQINIGQGPTTNGSEYEDEGYAPSPQRKNYEERHPYQQGNQRHTDDNLRLHAHTQNHQRSGSSSSFNYPNQTYQSNSRSHSPLQRERNDSPPPRTAQGTNGQSRWNDSAYPPNESLVSPDSYRSSQAMSSRSRSHSNATNLNTPPISATNPQTAFVKIKIFDRLADDLIAIRVHPKVTHAELMEKVHARLGAEVGNLRYRDSMTNTFVGLDSDDELRAWMEGTDKHVLYAD